MNYIKTKTVFIFVFERRLKMNYHLKNTRKELSKLRRSRKKEILKLRSEINKIGNKCKTEKINKPNLIY